MPNHIETLQLTPEQLERGAREESFSNLLAKWQAGEISDKQWEDMRNFDKDFRNWCFNMGVP